MLELPGYKIEKQIGKGGMAKVYLALHESLHRKVAIKVMAQHLSEDFNFSNRFIREARIVANLSHHNIVTIYDVNVYDGHHYIAMEYLPGGITLDHKIKEGIATQQGVEIIKQVAAALGYAHSKGIVHRDVKPENIMFREDGSAVLTDFGIARSTDTLATKMTSTGTVIGTPHYMSPEQGQGQEVGSCSDIYSLGVVLYEILTGKLPFTADSTIAVIFKHITEPVPTLEGELAKYQPVLNRMMAKMKEDRYQSCSEIIADLNSLQMGGEISMATMVDEVTRIQPKLQSKLTQHQATLASNNKHQQTTSTDATGKNKLLIPGIAASVLALAAMSGYAYYYQMLQAEQEKAQQAQIKQQAENEKLAKQERAAEQAANIAVAKPAKDDVLQKSAAANKFSLVDETNRRHQTQQELKSNKDTEKEKRLQERERKIYSLLATAEKSLLNSQLKSAYENYKAVLLLDSGNRNATAGINRVAGNYLTLATNAAINNDFDKANQYVNSAITIAPTHHKLAETQSKIFELKNAQAALQTTQQPAQQIKSAPSPEPEKKHRSFGGF